MFGGCRISAEKFSTSLVITGLLQVIAVSCKSLCCSAAARLQRPKAARVAGLHTAGAEAAWALCCKAHRGLWGLAAGCGVVFTQECQYVVTTHLGLRERETK